jgi:antibiotic biosynthesis monooxygenase (ABM) superfamily enzyme
MTDTSNRLGRPIPPPNKHQLALMIWLCVFPTLTVINLAFGDWLRTMSPWHGRSCSRRSRCRS